MRHRSPASRAHALSLTLDRELADARGQDLGWELERDLARVLDHADALARALDHAGGVGDGPVALADELIRDLVRARNLACSRPSARNLIRTLERARGRARTLERELDRVRSPVRASDLVRGSAGIGRSRDPAAHPHGTRPAVGKMPQGLVAIAVKVLPAQDRGRYGDEFWAEMHELHSHWQQLEYALRVLSSAGELRRALTEKMPPPEGARVRQATERSTPWRAD